MHRVATTHGYFCTRQDIIGAGLRQAVVDTGPGPARPK
jgi:hypothetical protein